MALKPRLQDVFETLKVAIVDALSYAGVAAPAQVGPGLPLATDLVEILGQDQYMVTIFERSGQRDETIELRAPYQIIDTNSTLGASEANGVITFSGSASPNLNVHTLVGIPVQDVYYRTQASDVDLADVAANVAEAINTAAISGVSATPNGASISVTGSPALACNISTSGLIFVQEVGRVSHSIQVSIWTADPMTRFAVEDAIMTQLGQADSQFLTLSDGSGVFVNFAGVGAGGESKLTDSAESSYSLFERHLVFFVRYPICKALTGATIGEVNAATALNANAPQSIVS